ncbi:hypothetical protein XELAEV_18023096mg [Xenopus laevis]|uniref:Uncharacterized protein n=1 Tax=Xenopus laevis TaxID=8355 RepID=A0A974D600_XENLA|nr:hypothetical protein XELAEV_18023096mg [Xenopus laevis]
MNDANYEICMIMILKSGMCVGSCRHYWSTQCYTTFGQETTKNNIVNFCPTSRQAHSDFSSLLYTPTFNLNMFIQAAWFYLYYIWMDFKQELSLCLWSVTSARTPMTSTEND